MVSAPNLEDLYIAGIIGTVEPDELDRIRGENAHAQKRHKPWRNLDTLTGNLDAIYALGPKCRIRHLNLHSTVSSGDSLRRLETVLHDTRPSALGVQLHLSSFHFADIPSIIPPFVREDLTHLQLSVTANSEEGDLISPAIVSLAPFYNPSSTD